MHRSRGAAPGMRTKTSRSCKRARRARAKLPSCPQSIVTKLVALGSGAMSWEVAISFRAAREEAMRSRTSAKYG